MSRSCILQSLVIVQPRSQPTTIPVLLLTCAMLACHCTICRDVVNPANVFDLATTCAVRGQSGRLQNIDAVYLAGYPRDTPAGTLMESSELHPVWQFDSICGICEPCTCLLVWSSACISARIVRQMRAPRNLMQWLAMAIMPDEQFVAPSCSESSMTRRD